MIEKLKAEFEDGEMTMIFVYNFHWLFYGYVINYPITYTLALEAIWKNTPNTQFIKPPLYIVWYWIY